MVASAHRLNGEALSVALRDEGGFTVLSPCPFDEGLRAEVHSLSPDVVIVDAGGLWTASAKRIVSEVRRSGDSSVLVVSDIEDEKVIAGALQSGEYAVVHRDQSVGALCSAVRELASGEEVATQVSASMLKRLRQTPAGSPLVNGVASGGLSLREVSVLGAVARGLTNDQIARETGVSPSTIKNQLHSACRKLGVSSRSHAVAEAIRREIIAPNGEPVPSALGARGIA